MNQPTVAIYGSPYVPEAPLAYQLLQERGFADIRKHRTDNNPYQLRELIQRTGQESVPQIFIDGEHVGGYEELVALDKSGALQSLASQKEEVSVFAQAFSFPIH